MAVNGLLGLKWLDLGGMDKKKLRNHWDFAGIAENSWKKMEIAGNCWNRLEWLNITEKSWNG